MPGPLARVLADQVEECLRRADELGLAQAGIHLDMALVALRGHGLAPPVDAEAPADVAAFSR